MLIGGLFVNPFMWIKIIGNIPTILTLAVAVIATPIIFLGYYLFILDAYGMIDASATWDIIWPDRGEVTTADRWIAANIWVAPYIEYVVSKTHNTETFDWNSQAQRGLFMTLSNFLFAETFMPAKWMVFWLWLPQLIWFKLHPEVFVDSQGYALPGWPEAIARTRDMLEMVVGNFAPFCSNPGGYHLKIE